MKPKRLEIARLKREVWPVNWICGALGVSRGGFYAWLKRAPSERCRTDEALSIKARVSFIGSDRTYGARRVWHDLLAKGVACGPHRIERLMSSQGLKARAEVFYYIECFNNPKRRHSTIGYLSPMEFERPFLESAVSNQFPILASMDFYPRSPAKKSATRDSELFRLCGKASECKFCLIKTSLRPNPARALQPHSQPRISIFPS